MIYDLHTHSTNSDGRSTLDDMCVSAIDRGVTGFALTDHADMNFYAQRDTFDRIGRSLADIEAARAKYGDRLHILRGVELGEYLYDPANADRLLGSYEFDVVLCSIHFVPGARFDRPYNRILFAEDGTDDELREYLRLYFELLNKTVDAFDFDVLAHMTCPVRYIVGLHQRRADVMEFEDMMRAILEKIIRRGIALEYNTGGLNERFHQYNVQNEELFTMYREMGGRRVTFGSDAHSAAGVGSNYIRAADALRALGFDRLCLYENRRPREISL